ncbi:MAG: hypothetical protein ACRDEA_08655 [Microcystaceae cyanobacterium]
MEKTKETMQNLEIKPKDDNTKLAKDYIERVLKQLLIDYQQTKEERHQIALWEETQEFTILGVIEIFTTDIRGYASQIIARDNLENRQEISDNLHKLKIFEVPYFTQWYFSNKSDYPQIKHYVETLNYLRLLIIEYIHDRHRE